MKRWRLRFFIFFFFLISEGDTEKILSLDCRFEWNPWGILPADLHRWKEDTLHQSAREASVYMQGTGWVGECLLLPLQHIFVHGVDWSVGIGGDDERVKWDDVMGVWEISEI